MATIDTPTIPQLLREFAGRASLRGGNPYRAKAYARAADRLAALVEPLRQVIAAGQLTEIPGIGEAIADIITKMYRTGTHPSLEAMRKEIPAGVLEMLAVPGCDLTRCSSFIRHSVSPHSPISREDRVKGAKELGGALQAKILQSLAIAHSGAGRLHMHRAAF